MRIFKTQDITRLYLFTSDAFNEPFPIFLENSDNRKYRCKLDSSFFLPSLVQTKETPVYIIFSSKSKVQNYRVQNCTDLMGKKPFSAAIYLLVFSTQRKHKQPFWIGKQKWFKGLHQKEITFIPSQVDNRFQPLFFFKKMGQTRPLFVYFRYFHDAKTNIASTMRMCDYKWKKRGWCAWDSNPGRQVGRRRRIHWAMAAPHFNHFWHAYGKGNSILCSTLPIGFCFLMRLNWKLLKSRQFLPSSLQVVENFI